MATSPTHETEHQITLSADPRAVYAVLADATAWPAVFPPTVHVERIEQSGGEERIRIWATANGRPKTWTSRRELDPEGLRVRFRQEVPAHPVAAMGGEWIVEPVGAGTTRVRLTHDFSAVDEDGLDFVAKAVDRNSEAELASLRAALEGAGQGAGAGDRLATFEDTVRVDGAASDVYDFLHRADLWPERLRHVARMALESETPDVQLMEMDTRTADGSTHTTASVRVCFPEHLIVYKQLRTPKLLAVHTGRWTVRPDGDGAVVTSQHTVAIAPEAVTGVLGEGATVTDAHAFAREALSRNSMTTLLAAKEYAEGRRSATV
ncbi:aromatase/cyclase [Nonomuraea sp. 3-1Str]|uniref:aromatase/cyclase n=1 Tax=Nonomuraea sp. 3-1Str TaxID=2929801 RepID=UPI0028550054|nr:aromatase/cyclase [Nonomuraea sp. 3-1Str]MDR8411821.1 aromatase/cyclase [Nonomuraea sp. 3-1Str]